MSDLAQEIRDEIREQGSIPVARYMELALQHPTHGYYTKGDPLGGEGDFITAPEVSQIFGELIGLWLAEAWRSMGKPEVFALLEMGPGRGTLMKDILRATRHVEGFAAARRLFFLESNETLRAKQKKLLANDLVESEKITYLTQIEKLPNLPLLFIGNEFLDALPIQQFIQKGEAWFERHVGLEGDVFVFQDKAIESLPKELKDAQGCCEISPSSCAVMRSLTRHVVAWGGAGLIIDYGYREPSGYPTFQAVRKHERVDPLENPGKADLTAHVDFTAMTHCAEKEGGFVLGAVYQSEFLEALGIKIRADFLKQRATDDQKRDLESAVHRLTHPSEMGYLFKVMGVAGSASLSCDLAGF